MRPRLPLLALLSALSLCACGGEEDAPAPQGGVAGVSGSSGQAGTSGEAGASGAAGSGQAGASGAAAGTGGAGTAGVAGAGGEGGNAGAGAAGAGAAGAGGSGGAGMAGTSAGGAAGAGGGCADCDGPGQACVGNQCIDDCRLASALPCGPGTVCNVSDQQGGVCKDPSADCVIGNAPQPCGAQECGSGTYCSPSQQCLPALPCNGMTCVNGRCTGNSCACTRPPASCQPAPLGKMGEAGTLNDPAFTRAVQPQEGLVDLEFDNECNAWGVTIISGTDFVRKITPAGQVSAVPGVTNLDMGEVAVLTGKEGFFGGGSGDVALTYTCCATCGCDISATGNPQGAALLDPETGELPMKIPSDVYTDGKGPFGNKLMDNGPQGLSWGLDRVLYLGNVKVNGEYAALDLLQGVSTTVVTLPERIYASTPFDAERMAVATESGKIFLVPTLGQAFAPVELLTLPSPATSLQRDPWSGRLYAELSSLDIVAIKADGSEVVTVAIAPQIGRIALAPDGFVYHIPAYGVPVEIVRFPMLGTLLSRCSIGIFCIHKKAMRSVRLPVHLGVDALWRKAGVAASLLPGVTLTATGLLAGFPGPGGLQVLVGGVLLLVAPGMAWLAWRARPSDALLDSEGVRIEGGAHDGLLVRWQDMARVKSGWADDMNVTHRLEVALRSGQTLVLAEATDTAEIASLRSLHETIRVHLGETAEPPPSRADLALCRGCGAPLVPGDQPAIRCRACGAENPVAPALRERVAAQRAADQAQRSTAQAVERLLQQPGVQGSRGALLLAALASAAAWALVLVSFRAAGLPSLDWFLIGSGFFSGWSLTFAAYSFARIALARRRALLVLSTTFGARPPSRQGEGPGCRNCGGPLPTDSGAVARCAYCGAQSVLGIDVRPLLERVRGHQGSIEDLLAAQQAERSTWLKLGLAASAAALLGGAWLGIQLSVTREFAEDLRRCEAGSGAACSKVALSYFNGSAVKEDRARAFKYREVACGQKIAEACGDMAAAYRFGWGVPQDRSKARASYEQACKLGHQESCKDLEGLDLSCSPPRQRAQRGRGVEVPLQLVLEVLAGLAPEQHARVRRLDGDRPGDQRTLRGEREHRVFALQSEAIFPARIRSRYGIVTPGKRDKKSRPPNISLDRQVLFSPSATGEAVFGGCLLALDPSSPADCSSLDSDGSLDSLPGGSLRQGEPAPLAWLAHAP